MTWRRRWVSRSGSQNYLRPRVCIRRASRWLFIDSGLIPGPRMSVSGNAISILGGHEDAIHFNPPEHISSNATYANNAGELVSVIRQQLKEGADFIKIYQTGADHFADGKFTTPYQYTEAELEAAVQETARVGKRVGVHCT